VVGCNLSRLLAPEFRASTIIEVMLRMLAIEWVACQRTSGPATHFSTQHDLWLLPNVSRLRTARIS
jgi:hypothetical protein